MGTRQWPRRASSSASRRRRRYAAAVSETPASACRSGSRFHEAYVGLRDGWSFIAALTVPTLVTALVVVAAARDRRPNLLTVAASAAVIGLVVYALHPQLVALG